MHLRLAADKAEQDALPIEEEEVADGR